MISILILLMTFPGVFVLSLLFEGVDRKIHARMQRRIGPPIIQPFYDFVKLFHKERIVPVTASSAIFTTAPLLAAAAAISAAAILVANLIMGAGIVGDVILVLYLLAMFSVMVMIGGSSSGNPYGAIGFSRKMTMMIAYELPMLISIVPLAFNPSFSLTYYGIVSTQTKMRTLLAFTYPSMAVAAFTFLLCIPAAADAVPFDISEAKTEIVHGPVVEYSGPYLALVKLAKAASNFALTFLVTSLFFYTPALFEGYISLGPGGALFLCLVTALFIMILTITVPRTIFARLKIGQAFKFYWLFPLILSMLSLALSIVGL